MTILTAAARVVPLTVLMLTACVSEKTSEAPTRQPWQARAGSGGRAKNRRIEIVLEAPGV